MRHPKASCWHVVHTTANSRRWPRGVMLTPSASVTCLQKKKKQALSSRVDRVGPGADGGAGAGCVGGRPHRRHDRPAAQPVAAQVRILLDENAHSPTMRMRSLHQEGLYVWRNSHYCLAVVPPDLWQHKRAAAWRRKSTCSSSQHPRLAVQHWYCFGTPV